MTVHRLIIEAGPGTVRRLCCGAAETARDAVPALAGMDDPVTLIDGQPVAVGALWSSVLRSLVCADRSIESMLVVHPSWWSAFRVELIVAAAHMLCDDIVTRSRAQLCTDGQDGQVLVEIAERLVAITGSGTLAEPRSGSPEEVAEAVVRRIPVAYGAGTVLIDGPIGIGGAAALAELISARLRAVRPEVTVELVDDSRLSHWAAVVAGPTQPSRPVPCDRGARRLPVLLTAGVLLSVAVAGAGGWHRRPASPGAETPMTFLVEGRVALQVPAQWPVQRISTGPGSARVAVISPSDPQVVLHVTQSPAPGATLAATADSLKKALTQANADQSANVFVDFNPAAVSAGRPAVTYREVRTHHHVDWTVLIDGVVRVGIGCQSAPGRIDAVQAVCDQAVRSVRALR